MLAVLVLVGQAERVKVCVALGVAPAPPCAPLLGVRVRLAVAQLLALGVGVSVEAPLPLTLTVPLPLLAAVAEGAEALGAALPLPPTSPAFKSLEGVKLGVTLACPTGLRLGAGTLGVPLRVPTAGPFKEARGDIDCVAVAVGTAQGVGVGAEDCEGV